MYREKHYIGFSFKHPLRVLEHIPVDKEGLLYKILGAGILPQGSPLLTYCRPQTSTEGPMPL